MRIYLRRRRYRLTIAKFIVCDIIYKESCIMKSKEPLDDIINLQDQGEVFSWKKRTGYGVGGAYLVEITEAAHEKRTKTRCAQLSR